MQHLPQSALDIHTSSNPRGFRHRTLIDLISMKEAILSHDLVLLIA
jgi:hypothetical protein